MKRSRNSYHYAIRRLEKQQENMKNDQLLNMGLNSTQFFKELGKPTYCKETTSSVIDDIYGATKISEHFKDQYEKLFNEQKTEDLDDIEKEITLGIENNSKASSEFINLLTSDVVKRAIGKLKKDKSDESG